MSKKIFSVLFMLLFVTSVSYAEDSIIFEVEGETFTMEEPVNVLINNELIQFEEQPYIYKSRTIVPMKFFFNELGYDISWDGETRTVTGNRGDKIIKLQIGSNNVNINGEVVVTDVPAVIINSRTYIPLSVVAMGSGASVNWNGETKTVLVKQKLENLNMFYGRSSLSNYNALLQNNELRHVDSIGYAWSRVEFEEGKVILNTSSVNNNLMFYPEGHEYVTNNEVESKLLNVYFDGRYEDLFSQKDGLISEITKAILKPKLNDPRFDGVIIDFELMNEKYFPSYLEIIKALNVELKKAGKLLYVAVQPRTGFDYNQLVKNVDFVILMLHDYESKDKIILNFNQNYVNQPITPIIRVESDLKMVMDQIKTLSDRSKISLQLNLAVVQWQGKSLYEVKRYTPSYFQLMVRMKKLPLGSFLYDEVSRNPYLQYQDENNLYNTIWYENESSIQAKLDLIFKYKLGGVSLWQIANIPLNDEIDDKNQLLIDKYDLNLWKKIMENY